MEHGSSPPECPVREADDTQRQLGGIEQACMDDLISEALLDRARALDDPGAVWPARARFFHANVLYRMNLDDDLALSMFRDAEQLAIAADDRRTCTLAVIRQVEWAEFHGRFDEARSRLAEAGDLALALGEPYQCARVQNALGMSLLKEERYAEAARSFEQAEALYALACRPKEMTAAAKRRFRVVYEGGGRAGLLAARPSGAHGPVQVAWAIVAVVAMSVPGAFFGDETSQLLLRLALEEPGLPDASRALAHYLAALGYAANSRLDQADQEYRLALSCPGIDLRIAAQCRCNLLGVGSLLGRLFGPEDVAFLFAPETLASVVSIAGLRVNRALHWMRMGSHERALDELEAALAEGDDPEGWARTDLLQLKANVLLELGRLPDAAEALRDAEASLPQDSPMLIKAFLAFRMADAWMRQECWQQACGHFGRVLKLLDLADPRPSIWHAALASELVCCAFDGQADALVRLRAAFDKSLADDASPPVVVAVYASALSSVSADSELAMLAAGAFVRAGLPLDAADSWNVAAAQAMAAGDREKALGYSRDAAVVLDDLLSILPDDEARVGVQHRMRHVRARLVHLIADTDIQGALHQAIRAKSSALLLLLHVRAVSRPELGSEVLQLFVATPGSSHLADRIPAASTASVVHSGRLDRTLPLERVRAIFRELTQIDPAAARLRMEWEVDPEAIVRAVPDGAVAVEYIIVAGEVLAFVVTARGIQLVRTPWSEEQEEATQAVRSMLDQRQIQGRVLERRMSSALRVLDDALVQPLEPSLSTAQRLILSPGAELSKIPFAALGSSDRGRLLDRFDIASLLTLAQMPALVPLSATAVRTALLLRGDDLGLHLPHATSELDEVEAILHTRCGSVLRLGPADALATCLLAMQSVDVFHFAGHAASPDREGMSAALATPERAITAAEILGMDLSRLRVCVLSAWETGRFAEMSSDEATGLLRALFVAGARNLVCSGWRADDRAAS